MGGTVDGGIWVTTVQGQTNFTTTRNSHTWRGGVEVQLAQRTSRDGAGNMSSFNYDNTYTRAANTTTVFPANQIGLTLAAFMLGMPSSVSIGNENGFDVTNNYFGTFVQDTWRVSRNLTLNIGLRYQYENGIKEAQNRAMLWFDPNAEVTIAAAAEAAYAQNPQPQLPPSQFNVQGGSVYAGTDGYGVRTWKPESLWMPRFSFGYKLGNKNVIKGGYGVYYDTLNARDWTPNQDGFDVTHHESAEHGQRPDVLAGGPAKRHPAAGRSVPRARSTAADTNSCRATNWATTTCWAAGSPPRIRTACTPAFSGGAWAGSGNSIRGRRSTSPTSGRTPTVRASPSARTICPRSTGAAATSATTR